MYLLKKRLTIPREGLQPTDDWGWSDQVDRKKYQWTSAGALVIA